MGEKTPIQTPGQVGERPGEIGRKQVEARKQAEYYIYIAIYLKSRTVYIEYVERGAGLDKVVKRVTASYKQIIDEVNDVEDRSVVVRTSEYTYVYRTGDNVMNGRIARIYVKYMRY